MVKQHRNILVQMNRDFVRTYKAACFAAILKSYYKRFSSHQIKIIFSDDLKNAFDVTMSGLFRFLGVRENFYCSGQKRW
jgi:hypothetical protein